MTSYKILFTYRIYWVINSVYSRSECNTSYMVLLIVIAFLLTVCVVVKLKSGPLSFSSVKILEKFERLDWIELTKGYRITIRSSVVSALPSFVCHLNNPPGSAWSVAKASQSTHGCVSEEAMWQGYTRINCLSRDVSETGKECLKSTWGKQHTEKILLYSTLDLTLFWLPSFPLRK